MFYGFFKQAQIEGYDAGNAFYLEGAARPQNPYDDRIAQLTEYTSSEYQVLVQQAEAWQDGFELAGDDS